MIISLTHEHDLDGLGSQAIIKRYYHLNPKFQNPEIKCYFAHYVDFIEKLSDILKNNKPPLELIISDIGFNKEFAKLFPIFEKLDPNKYSIKWFDHHIVDKDTIQRLRDVLNLYENDPKRCAAEIVKDYYLPDDPIAQQIAEFARDTDFKTHKFPKASELQLIIEYNRGEDLTTNKLKVVDLLSLGEFDNNWLSSQFESLQEWYKNEIEDALKNVYFIKVDNFGEIAITFSNIGGGKITDALFKNYPNLSAAIGIDKRYDEIIIHSEKLNCREFANSFNGGGHKMRAGFKYNPLFTSKNSLHPSFIKAIKQKIQIFNS
jgi:oligoribonuclease NrnB/cAMP/cGMP phosphodiesterase (DHH superfamily)